MEVMLNQTRREVAELMVLAHARYLAGEHRTTTICIDLDTRTMESTRNTSLHSQDIPVTTIDGWCLGDKPQGSTLTPEEFEALIDLSLDKQGFDMVPDETDLNGQKAAIWYKEEWLMVLTKAGVDPEEAIHTMQDLTQSLHTDHDTMTFRVINIWPDEMWDRINAWPDMAREWLGVVGLLG